MTMKEGRKINNDMRRRKPQDLWLDQTLNILSGVIIKINKDN